MNDAQCLYEFVNVMNFSFCKNLFSHTDTSGLYLRFRMHFTQPHNHKI
jgi:hypothetical protein